VVLSSLFIVAIIVQCTYVLYFFTRILWLPSGQELSPEDRESVSVIICARNEAANLVKNLPAVLAQHYRGKDGKPLFEVVVVNDGSTDDTATILQQLEAQHNHLKVVTIPQDADRTLPGKKYALSVGLSHAAHDQLLLTDADCKPASSNWLALMTAPLGKGKEIVAGYGGYEKTPGLLNAFIRWETVHTFLQYCTYAMTGRPYMAVGRNLACTRKALMLAQQNPAWSALPSGDDDLLVNIAGNGHNTTVVGNPEAFTYSEAKATMQDWVQQKQRHLSTGKYYRHSTQLLLGLYAVSHALVWFCFFALVAAGGGKAVILPMAVRSLLCWLSLFAAGRKLNEQKSGWSIPFFDLAWMVYNFAFLPYITWKNKQHWK